MSSCLDCALRTLKQQFTLPDTEKYRKKTPEICNDQIGLKVRPSTLIRKVGHGQFRILIKRNGKKKTLTKGNRDIQYDPRGPRNRPCGAWMKFIVLILFTISVR